MNYIESSRVLEIKKLHEGIQMFAHEALLNAIEIGEYLTAQKAYNPGTFIQWINDNLPFSDRTARNYMSLYEYRDKLESVSDLSGAYEAIEEIKRIENKEIKEAAEKRVEVAKATGEKPEGWRRGTDDKLLKEAIEKDEDPAEIKQHVAKTTREIMMEAAGIKPNTWKSLIRFEKDSGISQKYVDILSYTLSEAGDDQRRIEICNSIIKVCRDISIELQKM